MDAAVQMLLQMKLDYKRLTGQDYKTGCPPADGEMLVDNGAAPEDGDDQVDPWNVSPATPKESTTINSSVSRCYTPHFSPSAEDLLQV